MAIPGNEGPMAHVLHREFPTTPSARQLPVLVRRAMQLSKTNDVSRVADTLGSLATTAEYAIADLVAPLKAAAAAKKVAPIRGTPDVAQTATDVLAACDAPSDALAVGTAVLYIVRVAAATLALPTFAARMGFVEAVLREIAKRRASTWGPYLELALGFADELGDIVAGVVAIPGATSRCFGACCGTRL
jgi:hypothetical protein